MIKSDGNVGIGTTDPATPLHVYSTANDVLKIQGADHVRVLIDGTDSSEKSLNFSEAGSLMWKLGMENIAPFEAFVIKNNDNGAPQFVIDYNNGNVGVGTTTPKSLLEASGVIRSTHATSVSAGVGIEMVYNNTDGTGYLYSYDRDGSAYKTTRIGSESYFIADGNVGIATATPEHKFQVYGDALISGKFYDSTNSTGDKGYVLTSDDNGPLWKASGDFNGLSGNLVATGAIVDDQWKLDRNRSNVNKYHFSHWPNAAVSDYRKRW